MKNSSDENILCRALSLFIFLAEEYKQRNAKRPLHFYGVCAKFILIFNNRAKFVYHKKTRKSNRTKNATLLVLFSCEERESFRFPTKK